MLVPWLRPSQVISLCHACQAHITQNLKLPVVKITSSVKQWICDVKWTQNVSFIGPLNYSPCQSHATTFPSISTVTEHLAKKKKRGPPECRTAPPRSLMEMQTLQRPPSLSKSISVCSWDAQKRCRLFILSWQNRSSDSSTRNYCR